MLLDVQDSRKLPLVASFPNPASVLDMRFAGDGRSLYVVAAAGTLHQWQLPPAGKAATGANQQVPPSKPSFKPSSEPLGGSWPLAGPLSHGSGHLGGRPEEPFLLRQAQGLINHADPDRQWLIGDC
jgi:hypothetical protein